MNSSPEWRSWSAWRSQAKSKACLIAMRSIEATETATAPSPLAAASVPPEESNSSTTA